MSSPVLPPSRDRNRSGTPGATPTDFAPHSLWEGGRGGGLQRRRRVPRLYARHASARARYCIKNKFHSTGAPLRPVFAGLDPTIQSLIESLKNWMPVSSTSMTWLCLGGTCSDSDAAARRVVRNGAPMANPAPHRPRSRAPCQAHHAPRTGIKPWRLRARKPGWHPPSAASRPDVPPGGTPGQRPARPTPVHGGGRFAPSPGSGAALVSPHR